jgi:hypothetical protein
LRSSRPRLWPTKCTTAARRPASALHGSRSSVGHAAQKSVK